MAADPTVADPLAWRSVKAPSLEAIEALAETAFRRLPQKFRALCDGLVIRVEDFPTEEVLDELGAQSEFDLLGLFQGVPGARRFRRHLSEHAFRRGADVEVLRAALAQLDNPAKLPGQPLPRGTIAACSAH